VAYAESYPEPSVGGAYGHGWRQLWKYFLPLFLIGILTLIIGSGQTFLDFVSELGWWATDEGDVVGVAGLILALWTWFLSLEQFNFSYIRTSDEKSFGIVVV